VSILNQQTRLGAIATGDPGADRGEWMLKGYARLAAEDADRSAWLDKQMDAWRAEARAKHVEMHVPASYRRRHRKEAP
jgi:hypothetical protein